MSEEEKLQEKDTEEKHTTLSEDSVTETRPIQEKTTKEELKFENVEAAKDAKKEMNKILAELRQKMHEIDELTEEIDDKQKEINPTNPKKTKKLLQEIKVPPLEMLK